MENHKEHLNELLIKYSEGSISPDDFAHLLDAVNNASDEELFEVLGRHWDSFSLDGNEAFYNQKKDQLYKALSQEMRKHEKRFSLLSFLSQYWLRIAASLVLFIVVAWTINVSVAYFRMTDLDGQHVIVQSGSVGRSSVILPDGTKVKLNAKSQLSYRHDFGKESRQVVLNGQGFFEVAHDRRNKFVVKTDNMDITVYGTVFNVYAYEDNDIMEMSLLDGSVRVVTKGPLSQTFDVKSNEKVVYDKVTGKSHLEVTDNTFETAWMKGYLIFHEEKLGNVFSSLERRFGIVIHADDTEILNDVYTGTFNDEKFESIMKVLQLHYHFRYEIKEDIVYVYF